MNGGKNSRKERKQEGTMEFRKLDPLEVQASKFLWAQAFEGGSKDATYTDRWNSVFLERSKMYGIYDEAGLQAGFNTTDHQFYFGERLVPVSIFSGVATLPAARGKGYANDGVRKCYVKMREDGHYLTALTCFNWEFYQKLGFEMVGLQREYVVPVKILKTSKETEKVSAATLEDRPGIHECYAEFAKNYRGMIHRTEKHWNFYLDDQEKRFTYTYVYKNEGKIEGFLNYNNEPKDSTIYIQNFFALTPSARLGLLGMLKRMEMQVGKFKWTAPADDTLWTQVFHWDLKTEIWPSQMARIIDVPKALEAVKFRPHQSTAYQSLILEISDIDCPWNAGTWRVEMEDHKVTVTKSDEPPQVSMDIRALTQCYFGTPNVEEVANAEGMQIHDMSCYFALSDLLDGLPSFCLIHGEY